MAMTKAFAALAPATESSRDLLEALAALGLLWACSDMEVAQPRCCCLEFLPRLRRHLESRESTQFQNHRRPEQSTNMSMEILGVCKAICSPRRSLQSADCLRLAATGTL